MGIAGYQLKTLTQSLLLCVSSAVTVVHTF
jgi:hypothetical protein